VAQGGVDVILLDLGLPDSEGPATFSAARHSSQGVPIIILSGGDSEALALRMVQEGAQDYLVKSTCSSATLKKALRYAVVRHGKQGAVVAADRAKIIGVLGAKGGMGATTVACNLAVELRRQTEQRTLLADLDIDAGLVNFFMTIEAPHSVLDGINHLHHLDVSCWEGIVAQSADGLHMARSPFLMGADAPGLDRVRHLLTRVAGFYQWIMLDLGRLNTFSLSLLDRVDELFLVTTTAVPALYEAKRMIGALQKAGFEADRLRLIVNQFGDRNDYSGSYLDRIFGIPVYARLPGATQELHDACVNTRQLAENSEFRGHIARLARKMADLPELEEKAKSKVSQILSLATRFRKSDRHDSSTPVA
jgi:Flp pilus assembly CpaE family ATPase